MSTNDKYYDYDITSDKLIKQSEFNGYRLTIEIRDFFKNDNDIKVFFILNDVQRIEHSLDPNYLNDACKTIIINLIRNFQLLLTDEIIDVYLNDLDNHAKEVKLNFDNTHDVFKHYPNGLINETSSG